MIRRSAWFAGALWLALGLASPNARAQADSRLADARQAYAAVDYENTRALAQAALEQGGNDHGATSELYFLWAIAAAALDQTEEARAAFKHALAANPGLKLDRGLSPKIRAPYQEARGALIGADGRAPLQVDVRRRGTKMELAIRDTQALVDGVELSTRLHEGQAFARQHFRAGALRQVSVAAPEVEFFVRLLDRHGNVLLELGSESSPEHLAALATPTTTTGETAGKRDISPTPYYVTAAALGALGLASGVVSAAMLSRREEAARDWNGPDCEKPGSTRAEQCAKIDDRRRGAEHLSIGFAAGGGALLVGGLVTWLFAPSSKHASVSVDTTPHGVLLGLRTTL